MLLVPGSFRQLLWALSSIKLGEDLMEYLNLEASEYTHYIIHGISVGCYNFNNFTYELLLRNPEKYGHIQYKIKAIVYDSIGFAIGNGNADGVVKTVVYLIGLQAFRNVYLQRAFPEIMMIYFYLMRGFSLLQIERMFHMLQTTPLEVPTLFFYSENDPVSSHQDIRKLVERYKTMGSFTMLHKCWRESRHAAHLMIHTSEYLDCISKFLLAVPGLSDSPKPKTKL